MTSELDPASTARRLEKLSQQHARMIDAANALQREARAVKRQADTREKIILGGCLIRYAREDETVREWMLGLVEKRLNARDQGALGDLVAELRALP